MTTDQPKRSITQIQTNKDASLSSLAVTATADDAVLATVLAAVDPEMTAVELREGRQQSQAFSER